MKEMSTIVKTISNISFPFIVIYGLYVIAHGHLTPGGGFQGGAVVASGLVLMLIAYNAEWVSQRIKNTLTPPLPGCMNKLVNVPPA